LLYYVTPRRTTRSATREQATKAPRFRSPKLGIAKGNIADIQKGSWQPILEAQTALGNAASFPPVMVAESAVLSFSPG
jgi:hypothetical protein